jgi:DNA-binding transcriptional LysR family regulator
VRLTEVGARYLDDCRRLLAELEDIESAVRGAHSEPRGVLNVTASMTFGRLYVAPLILEFLDQHPRVSVRAVLNDSVLDLVDEGLDVAVRIAHLADSSFTALRVGEVRRVLCASPGYLRARGVPKSPDDLAQHEVVVFSQERSAAPWSFEGPKGKLSVRPRSRFVVNVSEVGIQAALAGRAITRVLSYMVAPELRAGRLRLVLEDYEPEPLPVHLVYREGRRAPARVRSFVDFASQRLRRQLAPLQRRKQRS